MITIFKLRSLLLLASTIFIITGCSSKNEVVEYNKPALYWYNKMITQISNNNLDEADDTYTSLESEHRNSPLLETSLLILVNAHMNEEEYSLSNFYLDEYTKRYSLSANIDYTRFLKIKANYLGFKYQLRDQELLEKTISDIATFKKRYYKSPYMPLVETMDSRLHMAKASLDKEISELYTRIDKPEAAKLYAKKVKESWVDEKEIVPVTVPFYRSIFE